MADIVLNQGESVPSTMQTRYVEQAGGEHSLQVTTDGSSVGSLPRWEYIDGELVTPAGVPTAATIPATATVVEIRSEGGPTYFQINGGAPASANSPGYVPQDSGEILGPLSNLNSVQFFAAVGVNIHILYFREVP